MGGKSFFKMSDECMKVEDFFINGDTFDAIYNNGINIERISLLLHYIIENSPFAFKEQPLLYEQMRQFIAMKIEIAVNNTINIDRGINACWMVLSTKLILP